MLSALDAGYLATVHTFRRRGAPIAFVFGKDSLHLRPDLALGLVLLDKSHIPRTLYFFDAS